MAAARYAVSLTERFHSLINLLHVFSQHAYSDDDMGIGVTMSNEIVERHLENNVLFPRALDPAAEAA